MPIQSLFRFGLSIAIAMIVMHGQAHPALSAEQPDTDKSSPLYETDILPLFRAKCFRCHGNDNRKADLDLTSLAGIRKGGESGPVIVVGNPEKSPLYEKVHEGEMPPDKKDRLTDAQVRAIAEWIAGGAKSKHDAGSPGTAATVNQHDIIPIMLRRCTVCHGVTRQDGGLDLRSKAAMLRGGKLGPALVPGKPDESRMLLRIHQGEMPPPDRLVEASVKPVDAAEEERLALWIAAGAPEVAVAPDVATTTPDPLVTDQDRDFWAFQPPAPVTVPQVRDQNRVRNPIDAFVLQKLEQLDLTLSPEASREALFRRVYFDVTGMPPEPTELATFLADTDPEAYSKLVERLLDSPRYGERWGRFWLDLAGYSESEGKREQDLPRHNAWRYRDYVIQSLNNDKPYDRFLLEQLAGDELEDYEHAAEITPAIYNNLVATAFLRMVPDATWANITGYAPDRIDVIADEIDVLGSGVMGLTLKCARCHTHKFDPIPQRDYYRLVDVFKGALDEYDWLKPDVRPGIGPVSQDFITGRLMPHVTTAERTAWKAREAKLQEGINTEIAALDREALERTSKLVEKRLAEIPETMRDDVRKMLATKADQRDEAQRNLAEKFEKTLTISREELTSLDPDFKKLSEASAGRIQSFASQKQSNPQIQALWDRGQPSPTYLYRRGDPTNAGPLVGPGVPSMLTDGKTPFEVTPPWPGAKQTGRRLAFAKWLTKPDHPLTARVAVNRLWRQHFGTGIVVTLGNFGRAGSPPSHPELLDWLAREFVQRGWSFKAMHRLMLTSATYRQSSTVTKEQELRDPDNIHLSRMPMVRLDAEAIYDSLLLLAGRMDETRYGPSDRVDGRGDGLMTPSGTARGWRRLIYVRQQRKSLPTHLENFDFPQMNPNCLERRDSMVAPQALYLMNNGMVQQLTDHFAARVEREAGSEPADQVQRAYLIALSRMPTDEEKVLGITCLTDLQKDFATAGNADPAAARSKSLAAYCHAIVNSAEFIFVD